MSCEERFADELLERYVRGELDERRSRALEEHYFECPACLERVEALQAVAGVLAPAGRPPAAMPSRARRAAVLLGGLAAASVLLIVLLREPEVGHPTVPRPRASGPAARPQPTTPPDAVATVVDYRDLAAISPPHYEVPALRGAGGDPDFEAAMARYAAGDFASAAAALDGVLRRAPADPRALFYAAISDLLANRYDDGVIRLRKVIATDDTPYLEEALFYLAKAHLQRGNAEAAERELERVIALRGDLEGVARELLDQVRARRAMGPTPSPSALPR